MTAPVGYGSLWVCCWPCPPALSGRACLWLSPSRPLVGSVCPQGSRTGACLLRLRLLLLLDLPLSLAGARPLGSSDKADPVAQIRTSGRGRDPPRGLGGGWPPPPLATVACSSPGPRPQASAVDTRPRQSTSPSDSRLPSGSQAGTLLPAQTGLFLEEEDEAAGAQACCLPSLLTPPPGILSRGWAGPLSPPPTPEGRCSTFSGTASGLRTPLCTSGPPGSRQGILPSGPQLGQMHKLLPSLAREALRQPSSDFACLQQQLPRVQLLPVGRKSSSPNPYVAVTAACRLSPSVPDPVSPSLSLCWDCTSV